MDSPETFTDWKNRIGLDVLDSGGKIELLELAFMAGQTSGLKTANILFQEKINEQQD